MVWNLKSNLSGNLKFNPAVKNVSVIQSLNPYTLHDWFLSVRVWLLSLCKCIICKNDLSRSRRMQEHMVPLSMSSLTTGANKFSFTVYSHPRVFGEHTQILVSIHGVSMTDTYLISLKILLIPIVSCSFLYPCHWSIAYTL